MMSLRGLAVGVLAATVLLNGPAWAQAEQEADQQAKGQKKESVRKQKEGLLPPQEALDQKDSDVSPDAYQPQGVDLGGFLLLPKMEVDLARNSNIYSTNYDAKHDIIHTYRPEVQLNSRFERHAINAMVRGERKEYNEFNNESVTNALAQVHGRYDITDRDNVTAGISYVHDHEDRGSPDDAGGIHPTEYHYLTAETAGTVTTGRFTSILGFIAAQRNWEDTITSTGVAPSHLRNRNDYELKLREAYEIIPGYSALTEAALIRRQYRQDADQFGYNRDSDGVRLSAGVGVDVSELIRGDFLAGYMRQDYKDPGLPDPSGYYVKALFNWMPTKLTSIIPGIQRSIEESTANRVSSLTRTEVTVTVRHELQRNLILGSDLAYAYEEQNGGNLETSTYSVSGRATYLFNRNLYTTLELTDKHKLANEEGKGFNQTIGMLRFGVQY